MSKPLRIAFVVKSTKYTDRAHYSSCYPEVHSETKYECATIENTTKFFLTFDSAIPDVGDLVILEQTNQYAYEPGKEWLCWRLVTE